MPFEIKIDVVKDGKIALWHRRDKLSAKSDEWSEPILGNSPREVVLKFADTLQRRPKRTP